MSEKLKPCPFCGDKRPKLRRFNTNSYRAICQSCGSQGSPGVIHSWHSTPFIAQSNAVKNWNRRAESDL